MITKSISERGLLLTGRSDSHVVPYKDKHRLHVEALGAFLRLQKRAAAEGFALEIVSSFRDYERQARIWNRKAGGFSPLLDPDGKQLEYALLTPDEIVDAILRWSALPGSSRHHWGTDIDVFDANRIALKDIQLIPAEYEVGGPNHGLSTWLEEQMRDGRAEGFYRPFRQDRGGISPEPWHLSYAPVSSEYFADYGLDLYLDNIREGSTLELRETLLGRGKELFQRFFKSVDLP